MSQQGPWPLPDTWRWVEFREAAEVKSDLRDPSRTPHAVHIAPNHIEARTGRLLNRGTVGDDEVTSPKHAFSSGQILYSKIRPYLAKVVMADCEGLCSADIYPISARQGVVESRFLRWWLLSPAFTRMVSESQGRTVLPKINQAALCKKLIPLPPLAEQKRIADKLDALLARVDACRERLDRVPGILKRFRQSVLAAATSGELTAEWREERDRNFAGWEQTTVGDLIEGIEAGLNMQCDERPPQAGERGLVKISAVTWGVYDDDESKTLPSGRHVPESTRIQVGDFLISRANTLELVGACVIVHHVSRPVFLSDKILRLVMPNGMKPWLLYVMRSEQGRRQIERLASGNQLSMRNLSQANLRCVVVPVPAEDERDEIVRRVEVLLCYAAHIERHYASVRAQVDRLTPSLLAEAFRGELVPQERADHLPNVLRDGIGSARRAR